MTGIVGFLSFPLMARAAETVYSPLKLNVPISGPELGAPVVRDGYLYVTFLAEYIQTAYDYLIGISMIAAAVMIVYGGFKYIVSSSGAGVQTGKEVIKDAIIGLLLVLGSYTILATINPGLTVLDQLKVQVVRPNPDQSYFDEFGSTPNDPKMMERNARPEPIPPGPALDISDVGFEKEKTGAAKIAAINRKGRELFAAATTYQEKMDALAKVIVGYEHVCVKLKQCAYCEGCSTGAERATTVTCSPQYAMRQASLANIDRIRKATSDVRCFSVIGNLNYKQLGWCEEDPMKCYNACSNYAVLAYERSFGPALIASGMWAGNCDSFAKGPYSNGLGYDLSKVLYDKSHFPDNSFKDPKGKYVTYGKDERGIKTMKFDEESWKADMMKFPTTFYVGHMVTFSKDIAAKGGLKFGDLIYISNGVGGGQHWFLYTGGRPDVHFSFIEMGGEANVNVPGWGGVGGVAEHPYGMMLEDFLESRIVGEVPYWCRKTSPSKSCFDKNGKLVRGKPKVNPAVAILVVYRPISE